MKELIIIGGGPAGLTAGMYAARARLNAVLIEKGFSGGQVITTDWIENYPGFPDGISGPELGQKFDDHAVKFGLEKAYGNVTQLTTDGKVKRLIFEDGATLDAKAVIIATGANPMQLGVQGEDEYRGKGVSYCATCDGAFFRNRKICVVGGGNTAIEEAIFLTKFASEVEIIHRRDQLRATKIIQEHAFANPKIKMRWNSIVERIIGLETVKAMTVKNIVTGEKVDVETDGVFIFVGYKPNTDFVKDVLTLDESGYIVVNSMLESSIPGIFAAGDVNNRFLKQVATAVGDGALAAVAAEKYIERQYV
jgi:thioredoxin reductase (NADPH)